MRYFFDIMVFWAVVIVAIRVLVHFPTACWLGSSSRSKVLYLFRASRAVNIFCVGRRFGVAGLYRLCACLAPAGSRCDGSCR